MFHQGIVENNDDPLKMGRCQVRILGEHTENRSTSDSNEYLPVADLPWAEMASPIQSANISGIGDFMIPQQGSVVWLFFKDPEKQFPVYFAVANTIPAARPDYTKGFSDPDSVHPEAASVGKSQIPDRAQEVNNITKTPTSSGSVTEPSEPYNAEYPKNRVIETEKGHIIELDDTDGNERIHIYHKSGTFIEIFPNGDHVLKAINNNYDITLGNKNVIVKGAEDREVEGNKTENIGGTCNIVVSGTCTIDASGKCTVKGSNVELDGGGGNISGCVTGYSICPFLMAPHPDKSSTVKASH
jgi:hypothetical protein